MIVRHPQFYHIGLHYDFSDFGQYDLSAVEKAIEGQALDWLRYAFNCYVVLSTSEPATIGGSILGAPGMSKAQFLICRIDMSDGFGWLPTWVWEWLHKDRSSLLGPRLPPPYPNIPPR